MNKTFHQRRGTAGFNLIEVTLAVAIAAVGLLSIIGLLGGGVQASRSVTDEFISTTLADDMLGWRRISPYERPTYFPYLATALTNTPRPFTFTEYFDVNGYLQYDLVGTLVTNWSPYFKFTYTIRDHPNFPNSPDIARVHLLVEWPLNPATSNAVPNAQRRHLVTNYSRLR